ncbi:hypothetical protein [Nonomuraea sp. NPDC049141]|uniref:effector-associated constant component EACC1 n=1 Tax=Nonomuraea sp. NPDC049141 TaxID=3155500 RepID=UPI0033F9359D
MEITVTIEGTADDLHSLYSWLSDDEELRGRVQLMEPPPQPGTLGSIPEMLTAALSPGGVIPAILVSGVITWMRHRTGEVVCKLTRPDGISVEVSAQRVRSTDMAEMRTLVTELCLSLEQGAGTETGLTAPSEQ